MTGNFIGIDFGTTNTSVVMILKDQYGERIKLLGENGEFPFASLLSIDYNNKVQIGNEVKKNRDSLAEAGQVVSSFKTLLGTNKKLRINNNEFTPVEVVAKYLECLKSFILKTHSVDISEAAFSFPVDFSPEARTELRDAAEMAGIKVNNLISESTAAYLATRESTKGLSRVMVIDWGGGTLDISILEIEGSIVKETTVYGEKIGGDDIDKELAERIHSQFNLKIDDKSNCVQFNEMSSEQRDKMISACERAKIEISEDGEDYLLTIRNYGNYGTKTLMISNDMFSDIVKPIIRNKVLNAIDIAMNRAEVSKGSIDAVIIAGGSSNLRPFADAIENVFGIEKIIRPEKFQFISAQGAAMMPLIGGKFKLNDDIGIVLSDESIFPLFRKNIDGVGSKGDTHTFSLVEDSPDAHFIITNGNGRIVYGKVDIPTKGFLKERLIVNSSIDFDQIARISIKSDSVPDEYKNNSVEISKLTYYYDLSDIVN